MMTFSENYMYVTYFLLFKKNKKNKSAYDHIAVLFSDMEKWVFIDPNLSSLGLGLLEINKQDGTLDYKMFDADLSVMRVTVKKKKYEELTRFKFLTLLIPRIVTCVSIIKYISGIRIFAFTPTMLFNKLRKLEKKGKIFKNIMDIQTVEI